MKQSSKPQFGKLPPQHRFVLNPYQDVRFSTCPNCDKKTKVRKLPLVIHVDPASLIALNKTCRLCPPCDLLIVHQDELEAQLAASLGKLDPSMIGNRYLVVGTLERAAWRNGMTEPQSIETMRDSMHDFKGYIQVKYVRGGWGPTRP